MARRFTGGSSDKVECPISFSSGPPLVYNTPINRDFTAFMLLKRTGSLDFHIYFVIADGTGDGWHLGVDSGANNTTLYAVARGVAAISSGLTVPLNTTVAMAVRWQIGTQVTFWIHPEGGSVSGGTPVASTATPGASATPANVDIVIGNQVSGVGQNLATPGDIQFAGVVEGLLTDLEVTNKLTAMLAGDFSAGTFDDRFWMSLSPGGAAADPEDDTSPNNQDSNLITGTTAVADLIAASGGSATTYTLEGPSTGTVGVPSSNFSVTPDAAVSADVVVTPSDGGAGGTFTPTTVTFTSGTSTPQTFTYTPASAGVKTISTTNDGGLTDPSSLSFTASAASSSPTLVQLERGIRGLNRGLA